MAYCTYTDVQLVIHTSLEQTDIEKIIAWSDAWIDSKLGSQAAGDKLIEKLSVLLTARTIKTRQPTSRAAGEYRETHDPVKVWGIEIDEIVDSYGAHRGKIARSAYQFIDEDDRYDEEIPG